eukprot:scaffold4178_cov257-Pinguiococcus_pyrenoidosus.AAC.9
MGQGLSSSFSSSETRKAKPLAAFSPTKATPAADAGRSESSKSLAMSRSTACLPMLREASVAGADVLAWLGRSKLPSVTGEACSF